MSNWRDAILNDFAPNVSKLTLVADPDCLLTEEKLAWALREQGFDIIEFDDPVDFRFAHESNYRLVWDKGKHTDLVVILRLQDVELELLPYDLLQAGRKLSFNLGEIFPNLSYPVIENLDRGLFDPLFEAQRKFQPERMGDNATKDFILRHVFTIAAELIINEIELLRALLRLHYSNVQIPIILADRFIQVLKDNQVFKAWPLIEIIRDDEAFFAFLQERWPVFLSKHGNNDEIRDGSAKYGNEKPLRFTGPEQLPFDHQDIRIYIDNLFLEGKLIPVEANDFDVDADSWVRTGMLASETDYDELRMSHLFSLVESELPSTQARYTDWISFSLKWAELSSLVHCSNNAEKQTRLKDIGRTINKTFDSWLADHYSSLINLPPTKPAMLHHVPRRLARDIEESPNVNVALIVVDGLALDQWVTVRQHLQKQDVNLVIRESATFAWIPTLTSVSRQAIFSGKSPLYFQSSINSTNKEENLWKHFWESHGLSKINVAYQRGLGDGDVSNTIDSLIHPGKTRVVGLVVDKVDKIMHGMQLGSAGMHNQIKQWCQTGYLTALISELMDYGYDIWLTADHGNVQCEGKGRPLEGVIAETRGERVRVYPTPELRSQIANNYLFTQEWPTEGLPSGYYPLVASGYDAFVKDGDIIVGHGGASIEEVIVPLVKIERIVVNG